MTLHYLFTLLNLPIGTSNHDMTQPLPRINIGVQYIRYTSECILKLQLHQHSLLTRKVFSRHNLSAQVFFSVSFGSSSSSCHLQVIFIFRSSSSLIHLHLQVIFIFKSSSSWSGSSLNLDHHCWVTTAGSSSLDLDHHHSIWIITGSSSQVLSLDSSHHRNFYRASPFSCWMYIYRAIPFSY